MKSLFRIILILSIPLLIESCKCEGPKTPKTIFSGVIVSGGKPVEGVIISINESQSKSDKDGSFSISVEAGEDSYLVSAEKFGYGLYSRAFNGGFTDKEINLTQGTIVEIDPTVDNEVVDTNSENTIMQSALMDLDTSQLFGIVPKVYDHTGKLIDLGYPPGLENIFDYVKEPITRRPGMRVNLRANSLRSASGSNPPAGSKLRVAVSTVDFFNPDGMPGDFVVRYQGDPRRFEPRDTLKKREIGKIKSLDSDEQNSSRLDDQEKQPDDTNENTEDRFAFMESYGAATVEITDGEESYNLKEGETAMVTVPIYEIRKVKNETPPQTIPLLHYNEGDGVWEVSGTGYLNETRDAYVGEVKHFSTLNFDLIKTGDSKCFKIRQMLKLNAIDNTANILSNYRAELIIPETSTSTFTERDYPVDESTGCVSVDGTSLHAVTRIPNDVPYIVAVFAQDLIADTLDIVIVNSAPTSILAETSVTSANDCTTSTCTPADITNCETTDDAIDANNPSISTCNTCWMPDCGLIPFENLGSELRIVGIPMGGGKVKVKWINVNDFSDQSIRVYANDSGGCSGVSTEIISASVCGGAGCIGDMCQSGEVIYPEVGIISGTASFRIEVFSTTDCTGIPTSACSDDVIVAP